MKAHQTKKVIVGISGGVDSAVSASLLMQQGYEVEGLFMKNWDKDDYSEHCNHKQDYQDAMQVCLALGIKLHYANFSEHYWHDVFEPFLAAIKQGKTPNPDIACNRAVKFDVFMHHAFSLDGDYIATGHYARRLAPDADGLYTSQDSNKDQTYFLAGVDVGALAKTLFPLGDMTKEQVRQTAQGLCLPVANKKDSTGICFIGERHMRDFLSRYIETVPGDIVDEAGVVIGQHHGVCLYTIGQRSGLGIGGVKGKSGAWYVAQKDLSANRLMVVQDVHHPLLRSYGVCCHNYNFLCDAMTLAQLLGQSLMVRLRHRGALVPCCASFANGALRVQFNEPQFAVATGQYAVLYAGDRCLGGGEIVHVHKDASPSVDVTNDVAELRA